MKAAESRVRRVRAGRLPCPGPGAPDSVRARAAAAAGRATWSGHVELPGGGPGGGKRDAGGAQPRATPKPVPCLSLAEPPQVGPNPAPGRWAGESGVPHHSQPGTRRARARTAERRRSPGSGCCRRNPSASPAAQRSLQQWPAPPGTSREEVAPESRCKKGWKANPEFSLCDNEIWLLSKCLICRSGSLRERRG